MRSYITAAALLLCAAPAHATLVTSSLAIDITRVYFVGDSAETVCQPCGANTITYTFDTNTNLPTNWSFDWWGDAGRAHYEYLSRAFSGFPADLFADEFADFGILYSDWVTSVDGWNGWEDFIFASWGEAGIWFTADIGTEAMIAEFNVLSPHSDPAPPPAVPEPASIALLLAGLAGMLVTSRNRQCL